MKPVYSILLFTLFLLGVFLLNTIGWIGGSEGSGVANQSFSEAEKDVGAMSRVSNFADLRLGHTGDWKLIFPKGKILDQRSQQQADGKSEQQILIATGQDSGLSKVRLISRSDGTISWMAAEWLLVVPVGPQVLQKSHEAEKFRLETIWGSDAVKICFSCSKLEDFDQAQARLAANKAVAHHEPDYLRFSLGTVPNDTWFQYQHYLENQGGLRGSLDADIDALDAWKVSQGSSNVVVAVLDGGLDVRHPDFSPNLKQNSRELPRNQVDDDGNGLIDDWQGWDFTMTRPLRTGSSHGNAVASLVGAVRDNNQGITGVCPQASLLPLRVMDDYGIGLVSSVVAALNYAVASGVKITNHSYGSADRSQLELDSINKAAEAGVLMLAAAGNEKTNLDRRPIYPACYSSANIICVAASDGFDHPASFSNTGSRSVDLFAPGTDIVSYVGSDIYEANSGTSLSTPLVTGTAALLLSANPDWSAADLKNVILNTVDLKPTLKALSVTGGRLNAGRALNATREPLIQTRLVNVHDGKVTGTSGDRDSVVESGELIGLEIEVRNAGAQPARQLASRLEIKGEPRVGVTLLRPTQTWADLAANAAVTNSRTPFLIKIAPDTQPGPLDFQIIHTAGTGQSWITEVVVDVMPSSTLAGRVTTPAGTPLAGVVVNYKGTTKGTVKTNKDGRYNLTLPNGRYEIEAALAGRLSSRPRVEVLPPSQMQVDFTLGQPQIKVTPTALSSTLSQQGSQTLALNVANAGDAPLEVRIEQQTTRLSVGSNLAWLPTYGALKRDGLDVWQAWQPTAEWRAAGRYGPWAPLPLVEGFETGVGGFLKDTMKDYEYRYLWVARFGRAVTGFAATGNGSLFYRDGGNGGNNYAFRRVAYGSRPRYFGVSMRRAHAFAKPLYVSLVWFPVKDPRDRPDPISPPSIQNPVSLITLGLSTFGRSFAFGDKPYTDEASGNAQIPDPDAWVRLEAVNIDWERSTFDYYMDGVLVRAAISFSYGQSYSFKHTDGVMISGEETEHDTWIDDLALSEEPKPWMQFSQEQITVPARGSVSVPVTLSAASLRPGSYGGRLDLHSNAPARPLVQVPVNLTVLNKLSNLAPIAESRTIYYTEDQPVEFTLPAKDAEGDALTISPSHLQDGAVLDKESGVYRLRYVPQPDAFGVQSNAEMSYVLQDYALASNPGVITFVGLPVQDAPKSVPDVFETRIGGPAQSLDVLANDSDVDGDVLTVLSVTTPLFGTATPSADRRSIIYTPPASLSKVDSFEYTVSDGHGGTATAQVRLGVPLIGGSWTTQGGDMGRSYSSPVVMGSGGLYSAWTASTLATNTEPIIAGGSVFVASTESSDPIRSLKVQAHDSRNGLLRWSRTWEGVRSFSSLSWYQGRIYLSLHEIVRQPNSCLCLCLDAANGRTLWQSQLNNSGAYVRSAAIVASPLVAEGVVVFQRPDQFYEAPLDSWGIAPFPGTVWHRFDAVTGMMLDGAGRTSVTPDVSAGLALIGNAMTIQPVVGWGQLNASTLTGIDMRSGALVWATSTSGFKPVICSSAGGHLIAQANWGNPGQKVVFTVDMTKPDNIQVVTTSYSNVAISAEQLQVTDISHFRKSRVQGFSPITTELISTTNGTPYGPNRVIQLADASLVWKAEPNPSWLSIFHHANPAVATQYTYYPGGKVAVGEGFVVSATTGKIQVLAPYSQDLPTATPQTLAGVENEPLPITLTGTSPTPGPLRRIISSLPARAKLYQTADGSTQAEEITSVPALVTNAAGRIIFIPEPDYNLDLFFTFQVENEAGISDATRIYVSMASRPSKPRAVSDQWALAAGGVLASFRPEANDINTEGGVVTLVSFTQPSRGTLTRNTDGSLRYEAEAGDPYETIFTYEVQNSLGLRSTGTVTLITDTPSTRLWSMEEGDGSRLSYYPGQLGTSPFVTSWTASSAITGPLIGGGGRVYAISPKIDNKTSRTLSAFSTLSGAELWTYPVFAECKITCDETSVYVTGLGENSDLPVQVLAISGATGQLRWNHTLPVSEFMDVVIAHPHLVVSVSKNRNGSLHFIHLSSGKITKVVNRIVIAGLDTSSLTEPRLCASAGIVYVNDIFLYGLNAASAEPLWWESSPSLFGAFKVLRNNLLFSTIYRSSQNGTLRVTDLRGTQLWNAAIYAYRLSYGVKACTPDMIVAGEFYQWGWDAYPFAAQASNGTRIALPGDLGARTWDSVAIPTLLSEDLWVDYRGSYSRSTGIKLQVLDATPTMALDGKLYGIGAGSRLVCMAPSTSGNSPPNASAATIEVTPAVDREITLTGSDPEGGPLEFVIANLPASGTLHQRASGGGAGAAILRAGSLVQDPERRVVYRPAAGTISSSSFRFAVVDDVSQRAEATISLKVVSQPPVLNLVARDDVLAVSGNLPIQIHPLANDTRPPGASLQLISHAQGQHGNVSVAGLVLTYTPTGTKAEDDRFSYTVRDENGLQSTADVVLLSAIGAGGWTEEDANPGKTRFVPLSLRGLRFEKRWINKDLYRHHEAHFADGHGRLVAYTDEGQVLDASTGFRLWSPIATEGLIRGNVWLGPFSFDRRTTIQRRSMSDGILLSEHLLSSWSRFFCATPTGLAFSVDDPNARITFADTEGRPTLKIPESQILNTAANENTLLLLMNEGLRAMSLQDGSSLWMLRPTDINATSIFGPQVFGDAVVVSVTTYDSTKGTSTARMACLDIQSGEIRWITPVPFYRSIVVANDQIYALSVSSTPGSNTVARIEARDLQTGMFLRTYQSAGLPINATDTNSATPIAVTQDTLVVNLNSLPDVRSSTYFIDLETDTIRQTVPTWSGFILSRDGLFSKNEGFLPVPEDSPVNLPPALPALSVSGYEDVPLRIALAGIDPEGDAVQARIDKLPSVGQLFLVNEDDSVGAAITTVATRVLGPRPEVFYRGPVDVSGANLAAFDFTLSDGKSSAVNGRISISLEAVNDPPIAHQDEFVVEAGELLLPVSVMRNDLDPEGGSLTLTSVGTPTLGRAWLTPAGALAYEAPRSSPLTTDTFSYTVTDPGGLSTTISVTILLRERRKPEWHAVGGGPKRNGWSSAWLWQNRVPLAQIWSKPAGSVAPGMSPVVAEGRLFVIGRMKVSTTNQAYSVIAYDTDTGTDIWYGGSDDGDQLFGVLSWQNGFLYLTARNYYGPGTLKALDSRIGDTLWKITIPGLSYSSITSFGPGLLISGQSGISSVRPDDGKLTLLSPTSGDFSMLGSQIYLGALREVQVLEWGNPLSVLRTISGITPEGWIYSDFIMPALSDRYCVVRREKLVSVIDISDGKISLQFEGVFRSFSSLAGREIILVEGADQNLTSYDVGSGRRLRTFASGRSNEYSRSSMQAVVTDNLVISAPPNSAGVSNDIYLWDRSSGAVVQTLTGGSNFVVAGDKLFQIRDDGGLVAWGSPAPVSFSLTPGTYTGPVQLRLTSSLPFAVIHFTLDGSAPNTLSPSILSGEEITLSADAEVRAIAVNAEFASSPNASTAIYRVRDITAPAAPPALVSRLSQSLDSDQDGKTDIDELLAGTNRFDTKDKLEVIESKSSQDGSTLRVTWTSESTRDYQIETSTDLKTWSLEAGSLPGTGGIMTREFSKPLGAATFFARVRVSP